MNQIKLPLHPETPLRRSSQNSHRKFRYDKDTTDQRIWHDGDTIM